MLGCLWLDGWQFRDLIPLWVSIRGPREAVPAALTERGVVIDDMVHLLRRQQIPVASSMSRLTPALPLPFLRRLRLFPRPAARLVGRGRLA
jgi:hypothetical protein